MRQHRVQARLGVRWFGQWTHERDTDLLEDGDGFRGVLDEQAPQARIVALDQRAHELFHVFVVRVERVDDSGFTLQPCRGGADRSNRKPRGSPKSWIFLDQGGFRALSCSRQCGHQAGAAAAYHDRVELERNVTIGY